MDSQMKEERETIAEILELTKKKPYPTKETVHLASFVDACFYVIEDLKKQEILKKQELERKKKELEELKRKEEEEHARQKELEETAPVPENAETLPPLLNVPELPSLEELQLENVPSPEPEIKALPKREYVIQLYNNPIGILVEKEADGSYEYKVIEPNLEQNIISKAKDMYAKEFERDNSLFDNEAFLKRVAEKVANKLGIPFNDMLPQKIHYYLERDLLGGNIFDPLLYDEKIKSIICEGPNKNIKINYADLGEMQTNISITNNDDLNRFIKRLAQAAGKIINEQNPLLNVNFEGLQFEGAIGIGGGSSRITIRRLAT